MTALFVALFLVSAAGLVAYFVRRAHTKDLEAYRESQGLSSGPVYYAGGSKNFDEFSGISAADVALGALSQEEVTQEYETEDFENAPTQEFEGDDPDRFEEFDKEVKKLYS